MHACEEVDMKSLAFAVGRNDQTFAGLHLQAPTARLAQPGFWYATKIGGRLLARRAARLAAYRPRVQEGPRRGLGARLAGHFDEHGPTVIQCTFEGRPELVGSGCSICRRPKALRELDEVRICQTLADEVTVESCFLIAQNIAEAALVKYDGDEIDLILHRRGKFLNPKHESAVATHGNDHLVRVGRLYSQCGHEAEAEIVLIPTADIGARRVNG